MLETCPLVPEISLLAMLLVLILTILIGFNSPSGVTIQKAGFTKLFKLTFWLSSQIKTVELSDVEIKLFNRLLISRWLLLVSLLVMAISGSFLSDCMNLITGVN